MHVGIDVDGVLVDVDEFILKTGEEIYGPMKNPKGYLVKDRWGLDEESDLNFWNTYRRSYVDTQIPMKGIEVFSKYLHDTNTPHTVITNRGDDASDPEEKEYIRVKTKEFVDHYLPEVRGVIHNGIGTKLPECLNNGIDVMIEDNVDHVKILSEHLYCILINQPHNIDFKHPRVIHANDLSEVPAILEILRSIIDGRKNK